MMRSTTMALSTILLVAGCAADAAPGGERDWKGERPFLIEDDTIPVDCGPYVSHHYRYTIDTRAEFEAIGDSGCTYFDDDVVIDLADVGFFTFDRLQTLTTVRRIEGDLTIDCTNMFGFDGLTNLREIGGDLDLTCGPDVYFDDLGFEGLVRVGGDVRIPELHLGRLEGFPALTEIAGTLSIDDFEGAIGGFDSLVRTGGLSFVGLRDARIESLQELETVAGDVSMHRIYGRLEGSLPALTDIWGDLSLEDWDEVQTVTQLPALTRVGVLPEGESLGEGERPGALRVESLHVDGLRSLRHVGGDFEFRGRLGGAPLVGPRSLERVGEGFVVEQADLPRIEGFDALQEVGGIFRIWKNRYQFEVDGFRRLESVGRTLLIRGDEYTASHHVDNETRVAVRGFDSLRDVGASNRIGAYTVDLDGVLFDPAAPAFGALENVFYSGIRLTFSAFAETQTEVLPSLTFVEGRLLVEENVNYRAAERLTTLEGFGALEGVGSGHGAAIDLAGLADLEHLDGFRDVVTVGGDIVLPGDFQRCRQFYFLFQSLEGYTGRVQCAGL